MAALFSVAAVLDATVVGLARLPTLGAALGGLAWIDLVEHRIPEPDRAPTTAVCAALLIEGGCTCRNCSADRPSSPAPVSAPTPRLAALLRADAPLIEVLADPQGREIRPIGLVIDYGGAFKALHALIVKGPS